MTLVNRTKIVNGNGKEARGLNGKEARGRGIRKAELKQTSPPFRKPKSQFRTILPSCPSPKVASPNWGEDVGIFVQFTKVKIMNIQIKLFSSSAKFLHA
ncbi:hypothetical protein FJZ31_34615 [Candidatus Poribacteria bacterium]|nr:hypothetical protein [Candidatus Poribacteria bacterium]